MATLLEFAGVHYFTKVLSNIIFKEFVFVLNLLWKSLSLKSKQSKIHGFVLFYIEKSVVKKLIVNNSF